MPMVNSAHKLQASPDTCITRVSNMMMPLCCITNSPQILVAYVHRSMMCQLGGDTLPCRKLQLDGLVSATGASVREGEGR